MKSICSIFLLLLFFGCVDSEGFGLLTLPSYDDNGPIARFDFDAETICSVSDRILNVTDATFVADHNHHPAGALRLYRTTGVMADAADMDFSATANFAIYIVVRPLGAFVDTGSRLLLTKGNTSSPFFLGVASTSGESPDTLIIFGGRHGVDNLMDLNDCSDLNLLSGKFSTANLNEYQQVVFQQRDTLQELYLNGSLVATSPVVQSGIPDCTFANQQPLFLGGYAAGIPDFDCDIAELRIYDRPLTGSEITGLYQR